MLRKGASDMNVERDILVKRLLEAGFDSRRFLKVNAEKKAFETNFQDRLYTPEELDQQGVTRYGICGKDGLVLIDTDKRGMADIIRKILPATFEATSPRRKLPHFYYVVEGDDVPNKTLHLPNDEDGSGEIRAQNQYLVAPGTVIRFKDLVTGQETTGTYKVLNDRPIVKVSCADFMKAVEPYFGGDPKQKITFEQMRQGVPQGIRHSQGIKYATFLVGIQQFDYATALHAMCEWNKLNRPPMDDGDLERMVENALGYVAANSPKVGKLGETRDLIAFFLKDIGARVKRDDPVKISVFTTGLSTYLESPINLFLRGESGVGKSYNVTETLKYFPQEDIWYLGGMSQKSLIHSHGTLLSKDGRLIDWDATPDKPKRRDFGKDDSASYNQAVQQYKEQKKVFSEKIRDSYTLIDLSRKILVFLEVPEYNTFQMLRPILSHDKMEIEYRFVDKTGIGQLRTMKVIIRGWPATIFLTIDRKYMEELSTRSFTVTPENSEEKIESANVLTNEKVSLPWKYQEETEAFTAISQLIRKLRDLTAKEKIGVIVPFPNLHELFPKQISRDMRDFTHFCESLQAVTLLHYYRRPIAVKGKKKFVVSTLEDVTRAMKVYKEIFETTRTGTEKRTLEFYHNIMMGKDSWYMKELTAAYNATAKKKLSERSVRVMLDRLDEIGYINIREDDEDKRTHLFIPLMKSEEMLQNLAESVSAIVLREKTEKGLETWKKIVAEKFAFYYNKKISESPEAWTEEPITPEQLQSVILNGQETIFSNKTPDSSATILNEEISPEAEKKPESIAERDSAPICNISALTIQEVLEKVAPHLTTVFPEEKLLKQIIGLGFSREEAQKRIDHFKQKEIISKDDVGNWNFARRS
jgi:DNA-binding MarR family transcriptional regulator